MSKRPQRNILAGLLAISLASTSVALLAEDKPAVFLVLDRTVLEVLRPSPSEVNDHIRTTGLRDALPYFASRVQKDVMLSVGADSWFGLQSVPDAWSSEPKAGDGLENYLYAGPGLGSPDASGEREKLLARVPGVYSLQLEVLDRLRNYPICALLYGEDLSLPDSKSRDGTYTADLRGATLGLLAFRVLAVSTSEGSESMAKVRILPTTEVCQGALSTITD